MRAFIAIPLPESLRSKLEKLQQELRKDTCLKLVPSENLHITVKFLGAVSDEEFEEWKKKVESLRIANINISIRGVGAFPSLEYVRVVWVGAEGCEGIAEQLGEKNFKGHITIARARCKPKLEGFFSAHSEEEFGTFSLNKVCIYESILGKPHARYVERHCKHVERF